MKDILLIQQVADYLNVCKDTLRNWHKKGKLVPDVHPITKTRFYKRKDVEEFLERHKRELEATQNEGEN